MNDREATIQALEGLLAEVQSLHMAQTVQRSAYVVLVRHLAAQGLAMPDVLAKDLETMAQTQTEPGWQSGHAELAGVLRLASGPPSVQRK